MEGRQEKGILERAAEQARGYEERIQRQLQSIDRLLENNRVLAIRQDELDADLTAERENVMDLDHKLARCDAEITRCQEALDLECNEHADDLAQLELVKLRNQQLEQLLEQYKAKLEFANAHMALMEHNVLRCSVCRECSDGMHLYVEQNQKRTGYTAVLEDGPAAGTELTDGSLDPLTNAPIGSLVTDEGDRYRLSKFDIGTRIAEYKHWPERPFSGEARQP